MIMTRANKFFSKDENDNIKETTRIAESKTIGEVAVMVVDSSDQYIEAEIIGGVLLGSLLSLIITLLYFHSSVWSYISFSFIFFFPAMSMFNKIPALKAAFIGKRRMAEAVRLRTVRAFYEKGLYKTKNNTGVLFFISLLERKVWVLADKGIYEKIKQESLNKFAGIVSKGIREGHACDALCAAIKESGELLAAHFPITHDDTNELSDHVMTE